MQGKVLKFFGTLGFIDLKKIDLFFLISDVLISDHYVSIKNFKSNQKIYNVGVPQGTVLGLLLFLTCKLLNIFHYIMLNFVHHADDTTAFFFCSGKNVANQMQTANEELAYIYILSCAQFSSNLFSSNFFRPFLLG